MTIGDSDLGWILKTAVLPLVNWVDQILDQKSYQQKIFLTGCQVNFNHFEKFSIVKNLKYEEFKKHGGAL